MRLLSRREYSARELKRKLESRFDPDLADEILLWLQQSDLQSDDRYGAMLLRSRVQRGQGPYRIRQEMLQKGLPERQISQLLDTAEIDWFELARETFERRFQRDEVRDEAEDPANRAATRAKQYRFLQYRGFTSDQIQYAMNPDD